MLTELQKENEPFRMDFTILDQVCRQTLLALAEVFIFFEAQWLLYAPPGLTFNKTGNALQRNTEGCGLVCIVDTGQTVTPLDPLGP